MANTNQIIISEKKKELEKLCSQLKCFSRKTLEFTLKMGELLNELKEILGPRGGFYKELKTLPDLSPRYAQKYMEVFKHKQAVESSAYNCSPFYTAYKITKIAASYESDEEYLKIEHKYIEENTTEDGELPVSLPPKKDSKITEKEGKDPTTNEAAPAINFNTPPGMANYENSEIEFPELKEYHSSTSADYPPSKIPNVVYSLTLNSSEGKIIHIADFEVTELLDVKVKSEILENIENALNDISNNIQASSVDDEITKADASNQEGEVA